MTPTIVTFLLTFVIIIVAIALLSIGLILVGRSRVRPGSCSRVPGDPDVDKKGTCKLCGKKPEDCDG